MIEIYLLLVVFIKESDVFLKQRHSKYSTREVLEFLTLYFGSSSSTYSNTPSSLNDDSNLRNMLSPSNITYYCNKRDIDLYKKLNNDILNIWYERYPTSKSSTIVHGRRISAADGSIVKVNISGLKGNTVSHVTLCTITDISTSIFLDVAVATDKDERKGFLDQMKYVKTDKTDIIVFDRGYGSTDFITAINNHTSFVIRMKSNFSYCSKLQAGTESSVIETIGGVTVRLIKYYVDLRTKQVILDYYNETGSIDSDDNLSEYILCTNDLSLTFVQLTLIYKARWQSEVNHKALKQNYNIRTLCNTKSKSHVDIKKKCEINLLSIVISFNIARMFEYTAIDEKFGTPLYGNKFIEPETQLVKRLNFTKVSSEVTRDISKLFLGVGGCIRSRITDMIKRLSSWKNTCYHDNNQPTREKEDPVSLPGPGLSTSSTNASPQTTERIPKNLVYRKSMYTALALFNSIVNAKNLDVATGIVDVVKPVKKQLHQTVLIQTLDIFFW